MKFSRKIGAELRSIFTCGDAEIMVYIWCRRLCVCKLHWRKCSPAQPSPAQPRPVWVCIMLGRPGHGTSGPCHVSSSPTAAILLLEFSPGYADWWKWYINLLRRHTVFWIYLLFCKSVFEWSSNNFRGDNFRILNLNRTPQQLCEGWFVISPYSLTEWQWQGWRLGGAQFPNPYMVTSQ